MPDPIQRPPTAPAMRPPAPGATARPRATILVVDDEAVVREFLSRCLERGGYAVKEAGNATEALELMEFDAASAVICDIRMPGQNGLWLAARLRARWPDTPVIMASAIDDMQTVRRSRDLGVVDYITKPIRPDQLLDVVRRVVPQSADTSSPTEDPMEELPPPTESRIEAEYTLETPVRCPACGERISTLKAVRLIRSQVNFTSTLPRRGRVIACPNCLSVIPAELTNF